MPAIVSREENRPMASKPRKPATKGRPVQSRAQARTAAGAEVVPSKDTKPTFGKAAPKKVVPGVMPKVAAKTAKPRKPAAAGSKAGAAMRAVVSFAASVIGRGGSKAKAK
jgi:hypothetical protein